MGAQMGGGSEKDENSKAGTSQTLSPPDNNFIMISIQQNQQLDLENQQLQQQQQQSLTQQSKSKLKPQPPNPFEMHKLQNTFKVLNEILNKEKAANNGVHKLLATCVPENNARGDFQGRYKFMGPDRAKLAKKFLRAHKEELEKELKAEKKQNKEAKHNAKKLSVNCGDARDAAEMSMAMSGDIGSIAMVGGMAALTKLSGGSSSESSEGGPKKPRAFGVPSTRGKPNPFGGG